MIGTHVGRHEEINKLDTNSLDDSVGLFIVNKKNSIYRIEISHMTPSKPIGVEYPLPSCSPKLISSTPFLEIRLAKSGRGLWHSAALQIEDVASLIE